MDTRTRRFDPGKVLATPGVLSLLCVAEISRLLDRHVTGDWGELDPHDAMANELALREGTRLLSSYRTNRGKVWIITEADRSVTTVLLPEEY